MSTYNEGVLRSEIKKWIRALLGFIAGRGLHAEIDGVKNDCASFRRLYLNGFRSFLQRKCSSFSANIPRLLYMMWPRVAFA